MLYEIRRSTCNDPKVELDYLRDKVNSLEDECTDLKKELKDVKAQMHSWIQVMQQQQNLTTPNLGAPISSAKNYNANQLRVQQRTASITIDLNSSSQVPGCEAVRMKSTESTTGLAVQENDWELFQNAMFMGSQGSCGLNLAKPSADRTISDPGLLDALLNAGGKLERDEDGESDNDDDSSYEETVPV